MRIEKTKDSMKPLWLNGFPNHTPAALTTLFANIIFLKISIESVMLCYATWLLMWCDGGTKWHEAFAVDQSENQRQEKHQ